MMFTLKKYFVVMSNTFFYLFLIIFCHALKRYFDVLTNIRKHMYLIIILAVMLFHITFNVNILIHQIANSSLQMCNNYKCI